MHSGALKAQHSSSLKIGAALCSGTISMVSFVYLHFWGKKVHRSARYLCLAWVNEQRFRYTFFGSGRRGRMDFSPFSSQSVRRLALTRTKLRLLSSHNLTRTKASHMRRGQQYSSVYTTMSRRCRLFSSLLPAHEASHVTLLVAIHNHTIVAYQKLLQRNELENFPQ